MYGVCKKLKLQEDVYVYVRGCMFECMCGCVLGAVCVCACVCVKGGVCKGMCMCMCMCACMCVGKGRCVCACRGRGAVYTHTPSTSVLRRWKPPLRCEGRNRNSAYGRYHCHCLGNYHIPGPGYCPGNCPGPGPLR